MQKKQTNKIIIKKRKGNASSEAFHGGSWKLAYADFTTALMAFFLLLWLLNATPNKKLREISQYFMPTLSFMTKNEQEDGSGKKIGIKEGVDMVGDIVDIRREGEKIDVFEMENEVFGKMESVVQDIQKENADMNKAISYTRTPDGLKITIYDQDKFEVFNKEGTQLTDFAKRALSRISKTIKVSPNLIQVIGYAYIAHSSPIDHYSSWELSVDRANVVRKFLLVNGISADKIYEIVGRTSSSNLGVDGTHSKKGKKITITLLRNVKLAGQKVSIPQNDK